MNAMKMWTKDEAEVEEQTEGEGVVVDSLVVFFLFGEKDFLRKPLIVVAVIDMPFIYYSWT